MSTRATKEHEGHEELLVPFVSLVILGAQVDFISLGGHRIGLPLDFHAARLSDGLGRLVDDEPWDGITDART